MPAIFVRARIKIADFEIPMTLPASDDAGLPRDGTMERETDLAEIIRRVGYDLAQLTDAEHIRVSTLARSAQVQLWRPGLRWPSSPGSELTGGEVTRP